MFEENTADPATEVEVTPEALLSAITNEEGAPKYASVEEGLKALKAAQEHIKTLETENSAFKEDLSKRQTAEELLAEIKKTSQPESRQDPSSNKGIDTTAIESLIEHKLAQRETIKTVQENQKTVVQKLKETFGDDAEKLFANKAAELGLGIRTFEEIAGKSPKAVLSYFDLRTTTTTPQSSGTVNTESIAPVQQLPSAKVPRGARSKDMVSAWRAAGELTKE